jgi:hypothetical protein
MKLTRFSQGLAAGIVLGAAVTGFAATHNYQYTGIVKEVSPSKLDVSKGSEVWDFVVDETTKGGHEVREGDHVTVTYRMLATKVEKK